MDNTTEKTTEETVTTTGTLAPEQVVKTTNVVTGPVDNTVHATEEVVTTSQATLSPQEVVRTTKTTVPPVVPVEHPAKVFKKKKTIFRSYQIIWYVLVLIEVLLGFRTALKALGANPQSGFATLVYAVSNPFALPFSGIFGTTAAEGSVFEWSNIVAAAVYALIAIGIVHLIHLSKPVTKQEVEQAVDNT